MKNPLEVLFKITLCGLPMAAITLYLGVVMPQHALQLNEVEAAQRGPSSPSEDARTRWLQNQAWGTEANGKDTALNILSANCKCSRNVIKKIHDEQLRPNSVLKNYQVLYLVLGQDSETEAELLDSGALFRLVDPEKVAQETGIVAGPRLALFKKDHGLVYWGGYGPEAPNPIVPIHWTELFKIAEADQQSKHPFPVKGCFSMGFKERWTSWLKF